MDFNENHQETLYENALKKPKVQENQMDADEKHVKSNEGIEESKQNPQAVQIGAENNANCVIEIESELSITGSGQHSKRDEKMEADPEVAVCVKKISPDSVDVSMYKVCADGNRQHHKCNEVNQQSYKENKRPIMADVPAEFISGMDMNAILPASPSVPTTIFRAFVMQLSNIGMNFEKALQRVKSVKNVSPKHQLKLYAFFKQATVGPCKTDKPNSFDVVNLAKWKAWSSLGTMNSVSVEIYDPAHSFC
ncbi:Enoyl-CoA delta isomerase 2, mitochondrial [Trichinella zimbabwensis]|uniref:Enoyl-CoA delta isomerase 2, mitochondrial n=1 Tax=Trichinella zimbabwensis TaxID=268475 RepID=A0A0V1GPF4_9BILA|nr:Enoyl-CoA delta isomerase 2, mitochondrial [Trichinella zimbabwensis]